MKSKNIFYGWYIVAATWFIYLALTSVTTYGGSVVTTHLVLDRGWSESIVGYQNAFLYAAIAVVSIPTGVLARKKGVKFLYIISALLGGGTCILFYLTNVPYLLYIGAYFFFGSSIAMGGHVTAPVMMDSWFDRRKSLAMAIVMTGGGIGGFFIPQVVEKLYSAFDARTCWLFMGIVELAALVPIILVERNSPQEVGEVRDGIEWNKNHSRPADAKKPAAKSHMTLSEACRTGTFVKIAVSNTAFRIAQNVFMAYAMLHMIHKGLPSAAAVTVISCSNILNMTGRLSVPFIEKLGIKKNAIAAGSFSLMLIGLLLFAFSEKIMILLPAGGMAGFATGIMMTLAPLLLSEYGEEAYFSEQYGMLNTISFACMIVTPLLVSGSASLFGDYKPTFLVLAAACGVSALLSGTLKRKAVQ
ncbi:MAG: MFS transporter [Lachnospiraceae bacterium]|nr:MFS transporter [Lachnospiraceae bacterium]